MDQCSQWHDIPSALQATSPNRPGHDLALGINIHPSRQQYSPASGSMISVPRIRAQTPQRHADRLPLVEFEPDPERPGRSRIRTSYTAEELPILIDHIFQEYRTESQG